MNDARTQRMVREALGGHVDVPFPERTIRNIGLIGILLLVAIAVSPPNENRRAIAGSAIDARAASAVNDAPPAKLAIDKNAAEGNVVDMTY